MSAVNKGLDRRAHAADPATERPLLRPPMKLIPVGPEYPRILYVTGSGLHGLRCVLRPLKSWPQGVVDIEVRGKDSMDHEIWTSSAAGCITLVPSRDRADRVNENDHVQLLAHMLRKMVPELYHAD